MTLAAPLALLILLLAVRALATTAEVVVAASLPPQWSRARASLLAGAASAVPLVASGAVAALVADVTWARAGRGWIPLAVALAVPCVVVLADLVPRGLAAELPPRSRRLVGPALTVFAILLAPVLAVEWVAARLLLGRRLGASPALVALRRLGGWLAARPGRELLDVSEAGLVARIARFAGKTARDGLVPLVDVCALPDTATVADAIALVRQRGFSRLPVFHERIFNVIGIVSSHELLGVADRTRPVTEAMRDAFFVPESKPLPELLTTLQAEGRNLAVVVDEYGGAVGLVTVEDLVEEIVGEIEDEYDAPRDLYRRIASGVYAVSARAQVNEVNERFGWNLPQGEYETVGGLVLERLGRVPKPGDALWAGRVRIQVTRATARAVQEVQVEEREGAFGRRGR